MKKFKNKWFYITSLLFYVLLIIIFTALTEKFIAPSAYSFVLANITSMYEANTNIVEIVIDDITYQKYNWSLDTKKELTAKILDYLYTYAKPKMVALDMFYPSLRDDNIHQASNFLGMIKKMDNLVNSFIPEYNKSGDDLRFMDDFKKKHSLNVTLKTRKSFPTIFTGIMDYSDILRESTKHYASIALDEDQNSKYLFNSNSIVKINDDFYPSLSLKMYLLLNNTNDLEIYDDYVYIPKTGLKFQYKYSKGYFYTPIRYYEFMRPNGDEIKYSHFPISASYIIKTYDALKKGITPKNSPDLYNSTFLDPEYFKDKIVYIGLNISGPSSDVRRTPLDDRHPGFDIQASILDNLLSDNTLNKKGSGYTILAFLLLCVPAFLIIMRQRFLKGIFILLMLDILYLIIVMTFAFFGNIINYAVPLVCQFVTTAFAYTFKFLNENRNKEQIKSAMGKYISKDVMNNVVIKNIENLGLGGKKAVVTVLFSDIRGFTSLSEKMTAEEVSLILNEYFAQMEPIITKYNGVINKFIGDAVMAIFGEPIADFNHPQNAVKCAYEMLKKVEYLREKWLFEGKPRIEIGIGINTGEVFIGNIGTENRMEYTVIGDTVNLASRIEGYNKVYKTNLLVSSSTYKYISDCADVIKIKEVQIRGKSKKMDIYEVLRIDI